VELFDHSLIKRKRTVKKTLPLKPPSARKPGLAPINRSLERGLDILRAFKAGTFALGNGEIAERTGLSKSTVSRLTQTLVTAGMLQLAQGRRSYHLAPLVLSLAHSMRAGSKVLATAAPLMRFTAEKYKVNIGLASPDQDEMVYLESIRYNKIASLRTVVSGQRVPMEQTSLGRAFLAVVSEEQRTKLYLHFKQNRPKKWPKLREELLHAKQSIEDKGFCFASWQPEVLAVATPIEVGTHIYTLNVSVSSKRDTTELIAELAPILMNLRSKIIDAIK